MNTLQTQGISVQKEGDFLTAFVEQKTPVQTVQLVVAGNQIYILIAEAAPPDESLFFGKEGLMELLPAIKSNILDRDYSSPIPENTKEIIAIEYGRSTSALNYIGNHGVAPDL